MADEPVRVLIADDHRLMREGTAALLASDERIEVVGLAADGREAIELSGRRRPDVALLDLNMPEVRGIEACAAIRQGSPDTEVLILTVSEQEPDLYASLRVGAAGYLLKSEPPERIASFLRGVADGEAALSGAVARSLLERVREGRGIGRGIPDEIADRLSARELEVLLLLDEHLGTDEIAARLFISEHTVRSHVKNRLRMLGVSSRRVALARLALARG